MMERTHDVRSGDPSLIELESWIEAARQGDREALGQALSSVRDYLLLVANEELDPALQSQRKCFRLVQETFLRAQRGMRSFSGPHGERMAALAAEHPDTQPRPGEAAVSFHRQAAGPARSDDPDERRLEAARETTKLPAAIWRVREREAALDRRTATSAGPLSRGGDMASPGAALV